MYDNFLKESKQKKKSVENEYDSSKVAQPSSDDNGKNSSKNKKPNKPANSQQKKSIDQMINELDEKEFNELITNIKEKFPNSTTVWLFEAAFYLNNNIQSNVKDILNVFSNLLGKLINFLFH